MQNKANSSNVKMNINAFITKLNENLQPCKHGKNKAKANPIKANFKSTIFNTGISSWGIKKVIIIIPDDAIFNPATACAACPNTVLFMSVDGTIGNRGILPIAGYINTAT